MRRQHGIVGSFLAGAALLAGCIDPAPEGADTLLMCGGGVFVDPSADPHNCGACGHDCQGTVCSAGACQPVVLVEGLVTQDVSLYSGLAVDADNLYWTDGATGVVSLSLAGGVPSTLTAVGAGYVYGGLALDSDSVYWTLVLPGLIQQSPDVGQMLTPATLASGQQAPTGIAVDDTGVYWTNNDDGTVMGLATGAKSPTLLATDANGPSGIAIDASYVYWTNNVMQTVNKVAKSGTGGIVQIATSPGAPSGIAVDATNVYWATGLPGAVMSVPLAGGNPTTIASENAGVTSLALDDTYVYWSLATTNGELHRAPKAGGAVDQLAVACPPATCPTDTIDVSFVAVNATFVYWTTAGLIAEVAK